MGTHAGEAHLKAPATGGGGSLLLSSELGDPSSRNVPGLLEMQGESLCVLIMFVPLLSQEDYAQGLTIPVWRSHVHGICNVSVMKPAGDHSSASVHQRSSESAQV
jgi:hypothetical protein